MKFILISRHTDGREVPENEIEQNVKDMGEWLALLHAEIAMPTRGGKSITAKKVGEYEGDVGGVIIFEAQNLDHALALTKKSPGLKYGFTHDVFPEISLDQAAKEKLKNS
jgi:hypothetical protein